MYDKGYYHSLKITAPGPNTPDHPQALVPRPKTPAAVTALPAIVRCGGPAAVFVGEEFLYAGCFLKSLPSTGI